MKANILLGLLLTFIFSLPVHAQSVYHFQYRASGQQDTTLYDAFFVQYRGGKGFMRVRYNAQGTNELILAEMNVRLQEIEGTPGVTDATKFYYDTVGRPDFKSGSSKTILPVPLFWFKLNSLNNNYEPFVVTFKDNRGQTQEGKLITKEFLESDVLDKNYLSQYFSPGEDFYEGNVQTSTRGFTDLEKKIKLILLIVANTNDPEVGSSAVLDVTRVVKTFDTIAHFMGIQMPKPVIISGPTYDKAHVQKAIKDLNPDVNDIVVFYYSGHGFRKKEDTRQFPYIDLRPKPDNTYNVNSLNIKDIYDSIRLKPKAARLNIVLSDCCNTIPTAAKKKGKSIVAERGMEDWSGENAAKLFINTTASILLTAADVGEEASCDSTVGSFFTIYFKAALENNLIKTNKHPDWNQVVKETKEETSFKVQHICCDSPCVWRNGCKQNAVKQIDPGKSNSIMGRLFQ